MFCCVMGDRIPGLRQPENTCMCWLLLWWCLVCTMSARSLSRFSIVWFSWHVQTCLSLLSWPYYYWYSKMISKESKDFLSNCMQELKNIRKRLIKWLVRFLCVILTSRSCRILSGIFVFAVLSSNENCNFQWSALCVELIHAATYREILQFLYKVFTL